jgi:RimJ/RimL family protein N-acetyltransferase
VVAITSTDNHGSMSVLRKIGMRFERTISLPGHNDVVNLFVPGVEDRNRPARD